MNNDDEKQKILIGFKKIVVNEMVDVYEKYPDFVKYLDDNFWDLLLDTNEKYDARKQSTGSSK